MRPRAPPRPDGTCSPRAPRRGHGVFRLALLLARDIILVLRHFLLRRARAFLPESEIVEKLFTDLAERYADRPSGFTRTTRLPRRVGDSAPMMLIELMPGVEEKAAPEAAAKPRRRLALPRRRAAAETTDEAAKPARKTTAKKTAAKKTVKAKA